MLYIYVRKLYIICCYASSFSTKDLTSINHSPYSCSSLLLAILTTHDAKSLSTPLLCKYSKILVFISSLSSPIAGEYGSGLSTFLFPPKGSTTTCSISNSPSSSSPSSLFLAIQAKESCDCDVSCSSVTIIGTALSLPPLCSNSAALKLTRALPFFSTTLAPSVDFKSKGDSAKILSTSIFSIIPSSSSSTSSSPRAFKNVFDMLRTFNNCCCCRITP
mmetsp:Transcript_5441/g.6888  ORF Transcript_5441/g.6888 Transcript_5441/m.6888 type:complete len:218 (-) Transcript_5441:689-1342(-)